VLFSDGVDTSSRYSSYNRSLNLVEESGALAYSVYYDTEADNPRGGVYGGGSPMAAFEHGETLLRVYFGFIGLDDAEFVIAEGLALGDSARKAGIDAAMLKAREVSIAPVVV